MGEYVLDLMESGQMDEYMPSEQEMTGEPEIQELPEQHDADQPF